MYFVRFESSMMLKQAAKSKLKIVDIIQTVKLQNGFFFGTETSSFVSFTSLENVTTEKEQKYQ